MLAVHTERAQYFQNSCVTVKVMTAGTHAIIMNLFCKIVKRNFQATTCLELQSYLFILLTPGPPRPSAGILEDSSSDAF